LPLPLLQLRQQQKWQQQLTWTKNSNNQPVVTEAARTTTIGKAATIAPETVIYKTKNH